MVTGPVASLPMDDAELAVTTVEAGARVVRSGFGGVLTRFYKGGGDFATDVDVEAERIITELLLTNRPADRVIGEESGERGVAGSKRCWLVDPLCGTLNFAAGTGPVAVNVALREGETVAAAAVTDPLGAVTYWTDGAGAWRRTRGEDRQLEPSAVSNLVDLNLDAPMFHYRPSRTIGLVVEKAFLSQFRPRVVSTSLALVWVACGQRAAYVSDGHLRGSVHFTPGIALCQAAGCVVTNLQGGPIHTGEEGLIAAADRSTHEALLAIINRMSRGGT